MPFATTQAYEMDRRQWLKMTGSMGVGLGVMMLLPEELYAAGMCAKITVENGSVDATQAGSTVQYWVDGLHYGTRTDLKSRANITLFINQKQSDTSFVESVVLMDDKKRTIGARYFDASTKMSSGHVPYVMFENVELTAAAYTAVYTVREGSKNKLYVAAINKAEVSRLNATWLPQKMRDDFKTFLAGTKENLTPGLVTSQFQFYTANSLAAHTARGRMKEMSADGSFKAKIEFMHADANANHYMRYFIVMDPVGRLLGFHKRTYGDGLSGSLEVAKITDAQKTDYNIPDLQIGNIADCPYVQVYTEDAYDAIARFVLRLR